MTSLFSSGLLARIAQLLPRYPIKKAALLPVLHLVQYERGLIGPEEEAAVAELLDLRLIEVREVVTFYTMFRQRPVGRHFLQICSNLSCTLRGGDRLLDHLRKRLGIEPGETTPDGRFTLTEVECLGACDESPCLMIGDVRHSGLTPDSLDAILRELK